MQKSFLLHTFAAVSKRIAEIAQLVEHDLAKVGVASSSLVFRSKALEWWNALRRSNGGIGRHEGLKIPWPVMAVRVQVPLRVRAEADRLRFVFFCFYTPISNSCMTRRNELCRILFLKYGIMCFSMVLFFF